MRAAHTLRSFAAFAALIAVPAAAAAPATAHATTSVSCGESALVDAVTAANAAGGGRLDLAPSCTYVLTVAHGAGAGPSGLPAITTPITLAGSATTITRASTAAAFRIVEVDGPSAHPGDNGQLTLASITVRGGDADLEVGGGIANLGGSVALSTSTVSGNRASYGGGVYTDTKLSLVASTVTGNTATVDGGGVYKNAGTVTRASSAVTGNTPDNCAPPGSVSGCSG